MHAYLYDAVRTPRAKARPDGTLAAIAPQELVRQQIAALDERCDGISRRADQLILGCVGQIGAQGGNIALHAKLHAALPAATAAYTINNYCVSGLSAIGLAAGAVASGAADRVLAGGVECMSRVPFMGDQAAYYTDSTLPAASRFIPVALAADLLATRENIGRAALDTVAAISHRRAATAGAPAASLIPVRGPDGALALDRDDCVRAATSPETLTSLQPAFGALAKQYRDALAGTAVEPIHTIAHAPPMVDGAALAVVGGAPTAGGARPRARILAYAEAGGDPRASLLAGFAAMEVALRRAGLDLRRMDRIEFMEAFAVVPALLLRNDDVDPAKVNVAGGHLARGHALGATGAILVSTLLDVLERDGGALGLVVATGASGIGAAVVLERTA